MGILVPADAFRSSPGIAPASDGLAVVSFHDTGKHQECTQSTPGLSSEEGFGSVEKVLLLTFLSAIILMAILGNLLVMVAVCRDRQLRKIKTNYFIVSLAFADLLVSVLVMPFGAIELVQDVWIYGEMFCLVRTSLDVLLTTASIFHLCCISLDRYYAICCQPLVYRNKMTPVRIALLLGGCWLVPMFISFLPIMQGWNNIGIVELIEQRKFNQHSNSTYCVFMVNKPYAVTCSVVAFYIPFLLMALAYYRIYVTARAHARQIRRLQRAGAGAAPEGGRGAGRGRAPPPADPHGATHRMRTETKAAKTLGVIMGCFCLCWAPFFVTNVADPFLDYAVPAQVWTAFLWLGYINSGLNPFLYAFLNKAFRRAFLSILCCDGGGRSRRPSVLLRPPAGPGSSSAAAAAAAPAPATASAATRQRLHAPAQPERQRFHRERVDSLPRIEDAAECGGRWESQCHPSEGDVSPGGRPAQ
ncbi:5-hydroxytryptamine receptor 4 [Perognathus longimembris pacificus]|uniref:5-hydroxytryptamine receptor 4 n=1 Tax=Perognathus longimembris pacificus TaxID=214514 RepID=UPI002018EF0B|nr:5-hydroxytryptamine receptor 4 [Perognathus longimembris pacificus]